MISHRFGQLALVEDFVVDIARLAVDISSARFVGVLGGEVFRVNLTLRHTSASGAAAFNISLIDGTLAGVDAPYGVVQTRFISGSGDFSMLLRSGEDASEIVRVGRLALGARVVVELVVELSPWMPLYANVTTDIIG